MDGLNDPDPIIRLVTYEKAVNAENATIQRVALRTALQGTDSDLRTLALLGALKGRDLISFKLTRNEKHEAALATAGDNMTRLKEVNKKFKNHQYGRRGVPPAHGIQFLTPNTSSPTCRIA